MELKEPHSEGQEPWVSPKLTSKSLYGLDVSLSQPRPQFTDLLFHIIHSGL